ncbi:hypothetical protein PMAYCL1PPCAC_06448, partial [Pristionchus mayeri]
SYSMGEGQSRLNQQHELHRAQLQEMRRQEALNEEQRRRQSDELVAQTIAAQKRAAEREEQLKDSIRKIEEEQLKRAQERSIDSFHNEHLKEFDERLKEKNAELESLRENSVKELEVLRKKQEEESRAHLEDLHNIHEKIVKIDESHTETVKKLLEERNDERKEMQNEIIAAHRQYQEAAFKMLKSRSETTAITFGILNNVIAKNAIEKDATTINTKIGNIREVLSKMEDERRKIIDWMVENDLKKKKKGFNALISRAVHDKGDAVKTHLKTMYDECTLLDALIKEVMTLVSNGTFAQDLIEKAKGPLTFGLGKASDLFDEIAKLRRAAAESPHSIVLEGVKECLNGLTLAMNSVPNLVIQSTTEYIHEEMKKLEISNENFLNHVIGPNGEDTLAIEGH